MSRNNTVAFSWRQSGSRKERWVLFVYVHRNVAAKLGWQGNFIAQASFMGRSELVIRPGKKGCEDQAAATFSNGSYSIAAKAPHLTATERLRGGCGAYSVQGNALLVTLPPWAWVTVPPRHDAEQPELEGVVRNEPGPEPGDWPMLTDGRDRRQEFLDACARTALQAAMMKASGGLPEGFAHQAYSMAEAMLEERERRYGRISP